MSAVPESANKGLENIVACTSEVSTIHDATLLYRGYTIEDLSEHCCFEEVIYLLWYGQLPTSDQLKALRHSLSQSMQLPAELMPILEFIAKTQAHSMAKLRTAISYFALLDSSAEDITGPSIKKQGIRLTAAMGPIVAAISRLEQKQEPLKPQLDQSIAWNFLKLIRNHDPDPSEVKLLDTALILHADHELNASTFTARVVASTTSDYYSAVTAAIGSLKGPLHGGANEQVMMMLREIGTYEQVDAFITQAVDAKKKVMGIGHRVYKNGDPRAKLLKELSIQVCRKAGLEHYHKMLVKIQEQMELKKGLMPNVDFYSGLVYTALQLRSRDFTPIFAMSRVVGWTAQVLEQYEHNRIYRPRAFYTGPTELRVEPIQKRS